MTLLQTDRVEDRPRPTHDDAIPARVRKTSSTIYGSFWLDKTEFALRAGVIREVVNEPAVISPMPLAPPFMLGLFSLRGAIIPVVDLRLLLELPDKEVADRKIVIIEDGDLCVGLVVDRTGEVLNAHGAAYVDFRPREGEIKDVVVEGLLKLEDGKRIVQVLDPYEVLHLEKVPRGEASSGTRSETSSRGRRYSCISFQFGHTTCAIDLRHVESVSEAPEITASVLVHDCFIGITNVRGAIIPVADFRNFMGDVAEIKSSHEDLRKRKMLTIRTDGGLVGLLVYSIDSILTFFEDEVLQFSKLALPRADVVRGCLLGEDNRIVMMLDHAVLKKDSILAGTARRCGEIHPHQDTVEDETKEHRKNARLTYIGFTVEKHFALDTTQVSEVISYPETLLQPPYKIDFVEGIINLRSELITLLNPRKVYGLPNQDCAAERVLIFKHKDRKYGIVVDSVDEIIITTKEKVAGLAALGPRDSSQVVADDVCACIESPTKGSLMVLDVDAFLGRCFRKIEADKPRSEIAV